MNTILDIMKKYHFTEMETLVYTSLLENGAMTGYETSKKSGVARSKVYNVLEKLIKKNLVVVNKSEPKLYYAISSEEFLERLENGFNHDLDILENQLGKIKVKEEEELWKLDNYASVYDKAHHMIKNSQTSLLIQIWEEDLGPSLVSLLQEAERRLSYFILVLFSNNHRYDIPFNKYYIHGFEKEKLEEFGSRWINVVSDEKEVVFGTINPDNDSVDVTWTKNHAMVNLSKEYIKHDAYSLKIIKENSQALKEQYGEDFGKIRLIYMED